MQEVTTVCIQVLNRSVAAFLRDNYGPAAVGRQVTIWFVADGRRRRVSLPVAAEVRRPKKRGRKTEWPSKAQRDILESLSGGRKRLKQLVAVVSSPARLYDKHGLDELRTMRLVETDGEFYSETAAGRELRESLA